MMISYDLRFREATGFRRSTNFEEMISCWSGCHSHNHFREFVEDFCYVWNHVKRYVIGVRKVGIHS
jgi:hypothetical protein